MRKKIVVLGDGLLGSEIIKQTGWDFLSRKKDGIDITNPDSYERLLRPYDQIVNCIGYTDTYSNDRQRHWDVNYLGVANLTDICVSKEKKLIHISTDYLYSNSVVFATENDVPVHCRNWYGYTKLLADGYIQLKAKNYLIVRTSFKPHPFPYELGLVCQVGNFDYTPIITGIIIKAISSDLVGIYNVGTELKTVYDLAIKTKNVSPLYTKISETMPVNVSMCLEKINSALDLKIKKDVYCGIYCFQNIINNKKYIGQAENIERRIDDHWSFLKHGYDDSLALQNAYNKYGKENFVAFIVEICPKELLSEREKYWIREMNSHVSEWGYNISWGGESPMKNRNHSEESKLKMSISKSSSGIFWYGKNLPEEMKINISKGRLGKKHTEETKRKISDTKFKNGNWWTGKKHTEETKRKISEGNKRKKENSSSKYFGVCFDKTKKKWQAFIRINGKTKYIGYFCTEIEAAMAYDDIASDFYGWKAKLNNLSLVEIKSIWEKYDNG